MHYEDPYQTAQIIDLPLKKKFLELCISSSVVIMKLKLKTKLNSMV
jgi:hypothetical protein